MQRTLHHSYCVLAALPYILVSLMVGLQADDAYAALPALGAIFGLGSVMLMLLGLTVVGTLLPSSEKAAGRVVAVTYVGGALMLLVGLL
ncbi:hypothetical protein JW899_04080 [Candidatus Uhrbacteria bacterium]|nr:hypothetical protein [Candidatus Uhrbacteria bacterium]